jgi:hypothetical protein
MSDGGCRWAIEDLHTPEPRLVLVGPHGNWITCCGLYCSYSRNRWTSLDARNFTHRLMERVQEHFPVEYALGQLLGSIK